MMNNTSTKSNGGQSWSATEVIGAGNDWMDRLFGWWYRYTTPPRVAENASFAKREAERRGRLLSTISFFLMVILIVFIPTDPPSALPTTFITLGIVVCALWANRSGKTLLAGIVIVAVGELAMAGVLLQPPYSGTQKD